MRLRNAVFHRLLRARRERALRRQIVGEMAALRQDLVAANAGPSVLLHDYDVRLLQRIADFYELYNTDISLHLGRTQDRALDLLRAFADSRCTSAPKARFGRIGDGGYVHLDDFDGLPAALSLGIGGEVS